MKYVIIWNELIEKGDLFFSVNMCVFVFMNDIFVKFVDA